MLLRVWASVSGLEWVWVWASVSELEWAWAWVLVWGSA
jgi:hypothetical protein